MSSIDAPFPEDNAWTRPFVNEGVASDRRPVDDVFPGVRQEAQAHAQCVFDITHDASSFRDALSAKEYRISGMCQSCQDSIFGA